MKEKAENEVVGDLATKTGMNLAVETVEESSKAARLISVDALRGFDMFWIVGVDAVIDALRKIIPHSPVMEFIGAQLRHVGWEGMHFEDLIMPLFMFLAGVSLPFSLAGRLAKNPSKMHLWGHIAKRVLLLWIFGMMVQGKLLSWEPAKFIFYNNTLQAIAAGYLIANVLHLYTPIRWKAFATAGLMLVTWAVFAWTPGMRGNYSPGGNVGRWLDCFIFGSHVDAYSYAWVLGSLNFGATTMLGVFAGELLRDREMSGNKKALWLAIGGVVAIGVAFLWMPFHPIIKHLWTGSFVLLSGGLSSMLLALFYWLIDVRGWKRWSFFFTVIGSNAIAAYMLERTWGGGGTFSRPLVIGLRHWLPPDLMELLLAVAALAALWVILWFLHRKNIYLKV